MFKDDINADKFNKLEWWVFTEKKMVFHFSNLEAL